VEARPDVLSFTSATLTEDLEVTGRVTVTLHAATSAADTDFTARLFDVWPWWARRTAPLPAGRPPSPAHPGRADRDERG
jgi:predicted acyl esterase